MTTWLLIFVFYHQGRNIEVVGHYSSLDICRAVGYRVQHELNLDLPFYCIEEPKIKDN